MQSQSVRTDLYFFSFERGASVSPLANAVEKENYWMESEGQLEVVPNFAEMCSVTLG